MGAPHPESPERELLRADPRRFSFRNYDLAKTDREAQREILRNFFDEVYDLAEISRSAILTDNHVVANDIPRRT